MIMIETEKWRALASALAATSDECEIKILLGEHNVCPAWMAEEDHHQVGTLQPGDTVRLKNPVMTVQSVTADEDAHCAWYEGAELRQGTFPIMTLDRIGTGDFVRFISEEESERPASK